MDSDTEDAGMVIDEGAPEGDADDKRVGREPVIRVPTVTLLQSSAPSLTVKTDAERTGSPSRSVAHIVTSPAAPKPASAHPGLPAVQLVPLTSASAPVKMAAVLAKTPPGLRTESVKISLMQPSSSTRPVTISTFGGAPQQLTRVVGAPPARLITIPVATSSGASPVVLHKAVPVVSRVSLPHQGSTPQMGDGALGIPIARVIPQPLGGAASGASAGPHFRIAPAINIVPIRPLEAQELPSLPGNVSVSIVTDSGRPAAIPPLQEAPAKQNSRPGILRRREGDREFYSQDVARPESRDDAGSSSGSTTLSASSPPADNATLSGDEAETHAEPSPRKKPRKQQLSSLRENSFVEADEAKPAASNGVVPAANHVARRRPRASLLTATTGTWRARYNHFLRYSDVRKKDDRKPTVNEIANEPLVMQRVNGWKMHYVSSQMEEILDLEVHFKDILSSLLKRLDAAACKDMTKDVSQVQEIIKANLQRCKIVHDQVRESKDHSMSLFEHKNRVKEILNKYLSRRQIKKKER